MFDLPRPKADEQLYADTMAKGFAAYPERKANFDKSRAAKRGLQVDFLPTKLDIENVSRCNYHCTMCQVSDWPGYKRAGDMTLEDFKQLIDSQIGLVEIKIQGMGEPFMGKPFIEMIQYARDRHIWVRSVTNASILHHNDNYKRAIDAGICELIVSIDGTTTETYEKIRRGGKWATVQKNCQLLNDYAKSVGRHRTRMWVVVQKDNFKEIRAFPRTAAELGFNRLTLSLDVHSWGQDAWKEANDAVSVDESFSQKLGEEIMADAKQRGVEQSFWFVESKFNTSAPEKLCFWPFERAFISSDMRISPCCMIANPEVRDLGDAKKFTEEWNGPKMKIFRAQHLKGEIPKECKMCYACD